MDTKTLRIKRVALDSLRLDPANVRQHDERNLEAIKGSLARFGQQKPIVVDGHGVIRAGNGTWEAARALGWTEIDVVETDLEGIEATAFAIADNRTSDLSEFDPPALAQLLDELRAEDALDGVGFDEADLDKLLRDLAAEEGPLDLADPGPMEPPEQPVSREGDLWILGNHRLFCGDSTDMQDVIRCMGDDKAALCATDPPYLVDYTGERPNDSGKDWTASYREVDITDAETFFRATFENILAALAPKAAFYCWHAHKRSGLIQRVWDELGIVDHQQIVWVKPASVFGRVYWHFRHEPCVMGWRKGSQPDHDGKHDFDSVWEVDWDGKARVATDHPTSKTTGAVRAPHAQAHARGRCGLRAVLWIGEPAHRSRGAKASLPGDRDQPCVRRRGDPAVGDGDWKHGTPGLYERDLRRSHGAAVMSQKIGPDGFKFYVSLGPGRSYKAVADHYGVTKRAVTKRAASEGWQQRLDAIEQQAREREDKELVEVVSEMRERHLITARAIQNRALAAIKAYPLTSGMEAVRAAELAIKLERIIVGEPSERTAMSVEEVTKREIQDLLVQDVERHED